MVAAVGMASGEREASAGVAVMDWLHKRNAPDRRLRWRAIPTSLRRHAANCHRDLIALQLCGAGAGKTKRAFSTIDMDPSPTRPGAPKTQMANRGASLFAIICVLGGTWRYLVL